MDLEQLQSYLDSSGATEYDPRSAESDGESLVMAAGKARYRSWQPGLNPNVTGARSNAKLILKTLSMFDIKKKLTSAFRRSAPIGVSICIVFYRLN